MNKIYLCIDLKTFYASCECAERKLNPFETNLVVADKRRGKGAICLAITPKMKLMGIKNRCRLYEIPNNVKPIIATPRMKLYIKYSAKIYSIYLRYISKDDIHPYSIDEMFLDVTNYLMLYDMTAECLAQKIMNDIYKETKITATCGIGTNLYLTKIALDIISKHNKSNIGYLDEDLFKKELWHHTPLTDFWGINIGTLNRLNNLHLKDMYDIAHANTNILYKTFGIQAEYLIDHAWGKETVTIKDIKSYKPKSTSISNSQILFRDYDYKEARIVMTEMIDNLILNLVSKDKTTNRVSVYIGYTKDYIEPLNFSFSLDNYTNSFPKILSKALYVYDYRINTEHKIRRIGLSFQNLETKKYEQCSLFSEENHEEDKKIEKTMLEIKNKFGKNSILRAISLDKNATQIERNRLIGGHNAE